MSIFNTTNFERQGNTDNDLHLKSTEEVCSTILSLSSGALRSIKIFTPDLEPQLYDNDVFRKNLLNFARGNRHATIQILVADTTPAIRYGHRLIRLAQQLTSAMQIRNIPEEYKDIPISFILIDQSSFLYRADGSTHNGLQSVCKHRANKLQELFTPAWEQAEQDPQTQRFNL